MYQVSFDISIYVLHNDDHMVIVVRVDSYGVTIRENDVSLWSSLLGFGESWEYYIHRHHMPDVFSPMGVRISSVDETSCNGVNHKI